MLVYAIVIGGLLAAIIEVPEARLSTILLSGTPATTTAGGDLLTETFDSAGYDDADWTEGIGDGNTVDENDTTSITGFSGQHLQLQQASGTIETYAYNSLASDQALTYIRFRINIQSEGLEDTDSINIHSSDVGAHTSPGTATHRMELIQTSGSLYFIYKTDGTVRDTSSAISTGTTYCVEIMVDNDGGAADGWEWRIDGSSEGSGAQDHAEDKGRFFFGAWSGSSSATFDVHIDNVDISSSDWIGDCS